MGSRSKVTLGSILVVGCAVGAAAAQGFVPKAVDWVLVVKPADTSGSGYWIGLRNAAKEPRAFCGLGIDYEVDLRSGDTIGSPTQSFPRIGSAHGCRRDTSHLVLPGETYFVWVDNVVIPADADPARPVRFRAVAEEACPDKKTCPQILITVTGS